MILIGLISNRRSHGNGGQPLLAAYAEAQSDVVFAAPDSLARFPDVLAEFARRGVDVVAVDGGDGTIRNVLTALPADYQPPLALLPSGKTNLVAHDVGSFGGGFNGLERLLASARSNFLDARLTERPTLEVQWRGQPGRPLRGMLFGTGIFTEATRMGCASPLTEHQAVAATLARSLWETLRGTGVAQAMTVSAGEPCPYAEPLHFLVLATTLERLMLGLWPFPDRGDGPIHWLDVPAPPKGLLRALWGAWRGRMGPRVKGGRTRALTLELADPFVVDGDLFDPGPQGIVLRPGPVIRFIGA